MCEVIETTTKFLELLTNVDKNYDTLLDKLSMLDKETSDLLHDLEFNNFCGREGYKKAKRLKEIRMKRRELKNTIEILSPLKGYHRMHAKTKIDLHKVATKMKAILEEQSSRVYTPRVCDDLKIANQHFKTGEQVIQNLNDCLLEQAL